MRATRRGKSATDSTVAGDGVGVERRPRGRPELEHLRAGENRSDHARWDVSGARLVRTLVRKGGGVMQTWPVQDAKARFSEFLEKCLTEGPQMVTKRGRAAVLVPADEWRRLQASARRSLKELLLLSDEARHNPVPPRGKARRRDPSALR